MNPKQVTDTFIDQKTTPNQLPTKSKSTAKKSESTPINNPLSTPKQPPPTHPPTHAHRMHMFRPSFLLLGRGKVSLNAILGRTSKLKKGIFKCKFGADLQIKRNTRPLIGSHHWWDSQPSLILKQARLTAKTTHTFGKHMLLPRAPMGGTVTGSIPAALANCSVTGNPRGHDHVAGISRKKRKKQVIHFIVIVLLRIAWLHVVFNVHIMIE